MPKATIDNKEIEFEPGETILDVARRVGIKIPTLCYYDRLEKAGTCRMCLIEVEKAPKLMTACTTEWRNGMVVHTDTERVQKARRGVLEFLLINHPLDCPVCDEAGDCQLQDLVYEYGAPVSRFIEEKQTFPKLELGPYIERDMNRCLNCRRCVRLTAELLGTFDFGATERGSHTVIGPYIEKLVGGGFTGNLIDICPCGALTDKRFRFQARVWDLDQVKAHRKNGCEHNCKVMLGIKEGKILRVSCRKTEEGYIESMICDECRFQHYKLNDWALEG